ncbi:MAG: flagellin [Anaerolineales bacterium]|nr:flagellin [Anaerolineales bacterium]
MFNKIKRTLGNESGITALETAIILIAFVVVASVFAFTILSAGTYSTEQSREAIYAGLEEVQGSLELRGEVVGYADATNSEILTITLSVANTAGGEPIDLQTSDKKVLIEYRDQYQNEKLSTWTVDWVIRPTADTDDLLEDGELAEITLPLSGLTTNLAEDTKFQIEVKPPQGATLLIERTTPSYLDTVMDLR